jgi:acetyl esterase/lipase
MTRLDLRVRLLGRAMRAAGVSIATMDSQLVARMQERGLDHNPLTDFLFGGVARSATLSDGVAAGGAGSIPIRVYRPKRTVEGPLPLVINFHGGGWILGSLDHTDWLCSNVAADVGVVVSIGYRLAPTHPWPAAADDCYAALLDIAARAAEFGADAQTLAVMGDSAGGNLAAVVALMARDRSGPPIRFQALIYPATDLTWSSPSVEENADAPILTKADCVAARDHYLGDQDPREPYISPLYAPDHSGLPPALVQVAEHDPIRDDGLRYAAALQAAGVEVRTTTYVGMPHGYLSFPKLCRSAPQALAELCTELSSALRPRRAPCIEVTTPA